MLPPSVPRMYTRRGSEAASTQAKAQFLAKIANTTTPRPNSAAAGAADISAGPERTALGPQFAACHARPASSVRWAASAHHCCICALVSVGDIGWAAAAGAATIMESATVAQIDFEKFIVTLLSINGPVYGDGEAALFRGRNFEHFGLEHKAGGLEPRSR